MRSKNFALLAIAFLATACGQDNIRGRYEGFQTIETTDHYSESLPLTLEITSVTDEGRVMGEWRGDQGAESGRFFGLWDEDTTIENATASIHDPNVPLVYQRNSRVKEEPRQAPRTEPQDEEDPNDIPVAMRGSSRAMGSENCFTNFTGNLTIESGRITGTLRYDSNNPACPTDVSSRHVELNLVESYENNQK